MAMLLSRKRCRKAIFLASLTLVNLFTILGCVVQKNEEPISSPYDLPDSVWTSELPDMMLHVSPNKEAAMGSSGGSESYITVKGEMIPVDMLIERGRYAIIIKEGKHNAEDILLGGYLIKLTNKEVIIQVQDDQVYGGKYTEIILKRVSP